MRPSHSATSPAVLPLRPQPLCSAHDQACLSPPSARARRRLLDRARAAAAACATASGTSGSRSAARARARTRADGLGGPAADAGNMDVRRSRIDEFGDVRNAGKSAVSYLLRGADAQRLPDAVRSAADGDNAGPDVVRRAQSAASGGAGRARCNRDPYRARSVSRQCRVQSRADFGRDRGAGDARIAVMGRARTCHRGLPQISS